MVSITKKWEKIPQLGKQANQSCPPLKVTSEIIANLPGMVPDTDPGDYLGDDIEFETVEVDEFRYHYGKPLIKPDHPTLTTMMRRFHEWCMKTCSESGKDTLTLRIKEEHDLVGMDQLSVEFDKLFHLYNQKALDKTLVTCYYM